MDIGQIIIGSMFVATAYFAFSLAYELFAGGSRKAEQKRAAWFLQIRILQLKKTCRLRSVEMRQVFFFQISSLHSHSLSFEYRALFCRFPLTAICSAFFAW